ncbi:MAG TPA: acyltransferase family protein [Sphingomonas sp.]|nr:acyltransferase family protein [Sphingomonas sp.]
MVILLVRRLWPFVLACLLLCLVGAAAIFGWAPAIMDSTYDYGFARGLYGFFLGCLIYLLLMRRPDWRVPGGTIAELIVLMAIAWFLSHVGRGYASMAATPLFALAVWVFAQEPGWVSAALRSRVGRALGRWSYSIYMWHFVIIVGLFGAFKYLAGRTHSIRILDLPRVTDGKPLLGVSFGSLWIGDLLAILFLLLVIAVAAASYALIERPGIRAFGRLARRMKRSASLPEAPGEGRIA